jgi:hypothetical protein
MNRRYEIYALERGNTSEEQIREDRKKFPGGANAGYMCWLEAKWRAFWTETKKPVEEWWFRDRHGAEFTLWLAREEANRRGLVYPTFHEPIRGKTTWEAVRRYAVAINSQCLIRVCDARMQEGRSDG